MSNRVNPDSLNGLMNSLLVMGEDGESEEIRNSTRFTSDVAPLIYQDGRLVEANDYVIHIRFEEGIAISAEFAQVWATLYYDNGQPIGVSLKPANYKGKPTVSIFTTTDDECNQKLYFRTTVTYNQEDTNKYLLPLNYRNEKIQNTDNIWCKDRLIELSKDNAIASFALSLLKKKQNIKHSFDSLIQASNQGYPHAFTQLSWCFKTGNGTEKNTEKWIEILKLGATADDPRAKYELAMAYISGTEVKCNQELAVDLLKKTAGEYPLAYLELSKYYRYGNFEAHLNNRLDYDSEYTPPLELAMKVLSCFDVLSDEEWSGRVLAKFYLADCYEHGIGCDIDLEIAEQLYQEIVDVKNTKYIEVMEARFRLAKFKILHANAFTKGGNVALGRGMFLEASKAIEIVADADYVPAQLYLAQELISGKRFAKNTELGFSFLNILDPKQLSIKDNNIAKKLLLMSRKDEITVSLPAQKTPITKNAQRTEMPSKRLSTQSKKTKTVSLPPQYEEFDDDSNSIQIISMIIVVLVFLLVLCGLLISMI